MELLRDVAVNGFSPSSAPDADGLSAGMRSHGDQYDVGRIDSSNSEDSAMTSFGALFGMNMTGESFQNGKSSHIHHSPVPFLQACHHNQRANIDVAIPR